MITALPEPLRRAVSRYTGIVRTLEEPLPTPGEPPLFRATCEIGRADTLLGAPLGHVTGIGGAGLTRADAAAASVGEALERYSATYIDRQRLTVATADELGADAVAPSRFGLFSDRQYAQEAFPFRPFTADTRVAWTDGWEITSGRRVLLPAELVYLGDAGFGAMRIGYATSSGMACAPSVDEACARGLCEVVERDAFMIVWANRLSLPRLDWGGEPRLVALEERLFARTGLTYSVIDLSSIHGLPSFLGVVRSERGRWGAFGVGAGTAPTVERAWWKALSEAFAARSAGQKLAVLLPEPDFGPAGDGVLTFEDHIRYHSDRRRSAAAAFLDASGATNDITDVPVIDEKDPSATVLALAERVHRAGSTAYAVDVTSPDVRSLGLVVIKVVAPEFCTLDVPHAARFLGGPRLYQGAYEAGLSDAVLCPDDVNSEPHPFP
ncbi:MAG: YcaO-like family protein [Actinomycetes bacterium]